MWLWVHILDLSVSHVETIFRSLAQPCTFSHWFVSRWRFSLIINLNQFDYLLNSFFYRLMISSQCYQGYPSTHFRTSFKTLNISTHFVLVPSPIIHGSVERLNYPFIFAFSLFRIVFQVPSIISNPLHSLIFCAPMLVVWVWSIHLNLNLAYL